MLLAGAIFVLTLVLVIWQPRGLGIGWSAAFGAALALAAGGVQLADIPVVWHIVWNATATFIAVIIISLLLDESGFFEWAALHVSRWGRGRGRLLFTWRAYYTAGLTRHAGCYSRRHSARYFTRCPAASMTGSPSSFTNAPCCGAVRISSTTSDGRQSRVPCGVVTIGRLIRIGC